jgi:Arc/MetJ family transcription regulator
MKMTLHIDDDLLARVMEATGAGSKTAAIDLALREVDRRAKLVKLASEGLGVSGDALRDAIDPNYTLEHERRRETPVTYGRNSRSRR